MSVLSHLPRSEGKGNFGNEKGSSHRLAPGAMDDFSAEPEPEPVWHTERNLFTPDRAAGSQHRLISAMDRQAAWTNSIKRGL